MSWLPIVERELRVRARGKGSFRTRFIGALVAILFVGAMLVSGSLLRAPSGTGGVIFVTLGVLALMFSLLDGVRATSDCLSREKREGTIGLLFLTDLRGHDVVIGKLAATSLNSVYSLLAIFPPLAVSITLGGVTGGEFWRLTLTLVNTLFLSLSVGMFVSAVSWDERKAWLGTLGILAFITVMPLVGSLIWGTGMTLIQFSPIFAFRGLFDTAYRLDASRYWAATGGVHVLGWLMLAMASVALPRHWRQTNEGSPVRNWKTGSRERIPAGTTRDGARVQPVTGGARSRRGPANRALLESSPIVWLAERDGGLRGLLWALIGVYCMTTAGVLLVFGVSTGVAMGLFAGAVVLKIGLAVWVAMKASHAFPQARDSGALELLLSTPVTTEEIVEGHLRVLHRMFRGPVMVLAAVELTLYAGAIIFLDIQGSVWWVSALYGLYFGAFLFEGYLNLATAARLGLWAGLKAKRAGQALTWTLLPVAVLPMVAGYCCSILWPVIGLIKDVILIIYSNYQLKHRFRDQVSGRF